jgi:hypothetical protein
MPARSRRPLACEAGSGVESRSSAAKRGKETAANRPLSVARACRPSPRFVSGMFGGCSAPVLRRRVSNPSSAFYRITESAPGRPQLEEVFAELERALIGQRTAEALDQLRNEGRVYGPVPYGYEARNGQLAPKEGEQVVLEFMVAMRDGGASYAAIAKWLNAESIPAKQGGPWHPMSVRSVLATARRLEGLPDRKGVA